MGLVSDGDGGCHWHIAQLNQMEIRMLKVILILSIVFLGIYQYYSKINYVDGALCADFHYHTGYFWTIVLFELIKKNKLDHPAIYKKKFNS